MIEDPDMHGLNARQLMLRQRQAHGSRCNQEFPTAEGIKAVMEVSNQVGKVDIYGDGSYTTPPKWWVA